MHFIILFLSLISIKLSAAESSSTELTQSERRRLLTEIDNICGDTWCEGNFNYEFKDVQCNFTQKHCYLSFDYIDSEFRVPHVCTLQGFADRSQVINEKDEHFYTERFYEAISECIWNSEVVAYAQMNAYEIDSILSSCNNERSYWVEGRAAGKQEWKQENLIKKMKELAQRIESKSEVRSYSFFGTSPSLLWRACTDKIMDKFPSKLYQHASLIVTNKDKQMAALTLIRKKPSNSSDTVEEILIFQNFR